MNVIEDCMAWSSGLFTDEDILGSGNPEREVMELLKAKSEIAFNTMSNFESMPITLSATIDILSGKAADGVSIRDSLKIKAFGHAIDAITATPLDERQIFCKNFLCGLHGLVSEDEVENRERGKFRSRGVLLNNISYIPPEPHFLTDRWENGIRILANIEHPLEKACVSFLWLARTQFFYDCNKRTALLFMNAYLAKRGCSPFFMPENEAGKFRDSLMQFYTTGNADTILRILKDYAHEYASVNE